MYVRDWNDENIECYASRGGVINVADWKRNLVHGDVRPWPPPQLARKLTNPGRAEAFAAEDLARLTAKLGYLSRFQSLNSEDSLAWSWFGTLAHAPSSVRRDVTDWLLSQIGVSAAVTAADIDLWERVPNPCHESRPGPELDARIRTDSALLYVECKWNAPLAFGKTAGEGEKMDQVQLRRCALRKDEQAEESELSLVVLGVTRDPFDPGDRYTATDQPGARPVEIKWLTWNDLAGCERHPHAEEFRRYLDWRQVMGEIRPL